MRENHLLTVSRVQALHCKKPVKTGLKTQTVDDTLKVKSRASRDHTLDSKHFIYKRKRDPEKLGSVLAQALEPGSRVSYLLPLFPDPSPSFFPFLSFLYPFLPFFLSSFLSQSFPSSSKIIWMLSFHSIPQGGSYSENTI